MLPCQVEDSYGDSLISSCYYEHLINQGFAQGSNFSLRWHVKRIFQFLQQAVYFVLFPSRRILLHKAHPLPFESDQPRLFGQGYPS